MRRMLSLDILKYFACFLVICIHMDLPESFECVIRPLLTTAVPVFFMITGYFYDQTLSVGKAKKQILKIACLALVANAVHLGYCVFKHVLNGEPLLRLGAEIAESAALVNFIIFNQPVWRTSLWFINALLIVLICVYPIRKSETLRKLYPLIPVLLLCNLLLGTYSFSLPIGEHLPLCYSRNFLFCGLPYFLMGNFIFSYRQNLSRCLGKWQYTALFFLACCAELWLLIYTKKLHYEDHLVGTFPLAVSLFCFFLEKEDFFGGNAWTKIAEFGRKHSFVIYITHSIIIEILYKTVAIVSKRLPFVSNAFEFAGPFVVLALSTAFASLFEYLTDKVKSPRTA